MSKLTSPERITAKVALNNLAIRILKLRQLNQEQTDLLLKEIESEKKLLDLDLDMNEFALGTKGRPASAMYFYIEPDDKSRKPYVIESSCPLEEVKRDLPNAEVNRIPYPLALCITPEQCKGKTSCPRSYSCSE